MNLARNSLNFKIHLEELKSTEYLFNELMRFGGITSIRGFEENSIYAKIMGVLCSEYRYRFSNDYLHTVVDSAYFEDINDSSQKYLDLDLDSAYKLMEVF